MAHRNTSTTEAAALRTSLRFSVRKLRADLDGIRQDEWLPHYNGNVYNAGSWSVAALLNARGESTMIYASASATPLPTPALLRCTYLRRVLAEVPGNIRVARLMQVLPGAHIESHADSGFGIAAGEVRLHVPIITEPALDFRVGGRRLRMQAGELWYADFSLEHEIRHRGRAPRIHLVVDSQLNPELRRVLDDAPFRIPAAGRHPLRHRLPRIVPVPGAGAKTEPLQTILAFLRKIELPVQAGRTSGTRLAPGLTFRNGALIIDEQNLNDAFDILVYAGLVATVPAAERPALTVYNLAGRDDEPLASGWAYAAALHLGLPARDLHPAAANLLDWAGLGNLAGAIRDGRPTGPPWLRA